MRTVKGRKSKRILHQQKGGAGSQDRGQKGVSRKPLLARGAVNPAERAKRQRLRPGDFETPVPRSMKLTKRRFGTSITGSTTMTNGLPNGAANSRKNIGSR